MTTQNNTKQTEKGANSMEITYRMQDGFQVPNLLMPQTPEAHLGKYAELRRAYLKKHRRVLYTNLKTSGKLAEHLAEIEQTARKMVEQTVARMAQAEGVTEELKATDPLRWTGLMNNLRHSAEELVLSDLIGRGHLRGISVNGFCGQPLRFFRESIIQLPHFLDLRVDIACPQVLFTPAPCAEEVITVSAQAIQQHIIPAVIDKGRKLITSCLCGFFGCQA